ncbi:MAG: aldehyde dehydrogenase family protein [Nitrososphaeria archaeon]
MKRMIIGGYEKESDSQINIIDPSTLEPVESVSYTNSADIVDESISVASEAYVKYSSISLARRLELLKKAADLIQNSKERLAMLLARESGKPINEARVELSRAVSVFINSAEEVKIAIEGKSYRVDAYAYPPDNNRRIVFEIREPVGIIGAILPFNFPANGFAHKVAPNLAIGNTVVVKPSSQTPLTAIEMAKLIYAAGFPPGVVSVIVGNGEILGSALATDKRVSGITFTGSTVTGRRLASLALGKKLMLELGGSDPFIVFNDADVERAVQIGVKARFEYAGQNCNAAKRFIVQSNVYDKFVNKFAELAGKIWVGNAIDGRTEMGPLISAMAVSNAIRMVEDALQVNGKLLLDRRAVNIGKGYYMGPVVIKNPDIKSKVMQDETFAPIAPMISFENEEDAISVANSSPYGLQAAIFTKDISRALRVTKSIKAGAVLINDSTRLRWDTLPFGGLKESGIGEREGIRNTAITFSEVKMISLGV